MVNHVLAKARKYWNLGEAKIELIAARENRVYRVFTPAGSAALRLHRPGYRSVQQLHSELMWMEMLDDNGLNVPEPIRSCDGELLKSVGDTVISLLAWVDGKPFSEIETTTELYYKLGCTLGQMHILADQWSLPENFQRPCWDLVSDNPTWGQYWNNPFLSQAQVQRLHEFRRIAKDAVKTFNSLDYGLIHADLVPDNILNNDGQLQLIDFDDGGFGYRLFDLATITHRCRRAPHGAEIAKAAISGYCNTHAVDRGALSLFEALRACSYVGWNISRIDEHNGRERNTRFINEAEEAVNRFLSLGNF